MMSGDESRLPARDAGPVRRYVRDIVDSRHNFGTYFLLLFAVGYALGFVAPVLSLFLTPILLVGLVIDSVLLSRKVKAMVAQRFGPEQANGHSMYAVTRAVQIRRLRLPPPKVRPGPLKLPGRGG
jgi:hypothetical protein